MRLWVYRHALGKITLLFRAQLDPDLGRYRARNISLKAEHVADITVVFPGPQLTFGVDLRQVNTDAHPVTGALDRTFEHCIHAEVSCDLRQRLLAALKLHHGLP